MEYIPRQVSNSDVKDTTIDHTGVAESFIHLATAAPDEDDDEGTGFAVGCIWVDYSNGETYTCTTSTDEDATWLAQDGSDDVNPPFTIQGSNYGYSCGHFMDPGSPNFPGNINRYAMTSSGDGSDVGELGTAVRDVVSGSIRNDSYGYCTGGSTTPPNVSKDLIQRFTLAAPTTVVDIGETVRGQSYAAGATNGDHGFVYSGMEYASPSTAVNTIEKFALAAPPVTSADSGMEITTAVERGTGFSDTANAYGYLAGGTPLGTADTVNTIERFSFAGSGAASDYSEMTNDTLKSVGTASITHGYVAGGAPGAAYTDINVVEKVGFSAPTTIDDVGDLTSARSGIQGASGDTHAYHAGGADWGPSASVNIIDRSSTSADGNSADVGDLSEIGASGGGFES